jgi:hypothetical protein
MDLLFLCDRPCSPPGTWPGAPGRACPGTGCTVPPPPLPPEHIFLKRPLLPTGMDIFYISFDILKSFFTVGRALSNYQRSIGKPPVSLLNVIDSNTPALTLGPRLSYSFIGIARESASFILKR